jgi:hypothetical protein
MANAFRYVFGNNLYSGYWQCMPRENGRRVFRISYPEHANQFGDFIEIIETGDHDLPYQPKVPKDPDQFYSSIIQWFSDNKLLSG